MNFVKHDQMIKCLFFLILILSSPLHSHEIKPAVMDITIIEGNASIEFKLNAETVLSEIDASLYQDTNDSPQSQKYDALRALSTEEVEKMVIENENKFTDKIKINIGDETIPLSLRNVDTFQEINDEFPRDTTLNIGFEIKDESFTIQFEKELGPVIIRHFEDLSKKSVLFTTYLQPAERSSLISQQIRSSALSTTIEYLVLGIEHIVPKGLDHILFIIGIFFYAIKFKPLLLQVTMFTVAHSITLILASFNLIFIPATIVEPLIALSISYVAIENIFQRRSTLLRYLIIFIFGLIHGLGFAFVLGDIGLNTSQLVLSLISFNVGVEIAQIAIIILASIIFIIPSRQSWYRAFLQIPISIIISMIGLYWFIERVFF